MRDLGPKLGRRVLRYATAGAAQVFRDAARTKAPIRQPEAKGRRIFSTKYGDRVPGLLKRSLIAVRNSRASGKSVETYSMTVRTGDPPTKGGVSRDAYYWRWVEAGHIKRQAGGALKGGEKRKREQRVTLGQTGQFVQGRWYIRQAFEASTNRAIDEFYRRVDYKFRTLKL